MEVCTTYEEHCVDLPPFQSKRPRTDSPSPQPSQGTSMTCDSKGRRLPQPNPAYIPILCTRKLRVPENCRPSNNIQSSFPRTCNNKTDEEVKSTTQQLMMQNQAAGNESRSSDPRYPRIRCCKLPNGEVHTFSQARPSNPLNRDCKPLEVLRQKLQNCRKIRLSELPVDLKLCERPLPPTTVVPNPGKTSLTVENETKDDKRTSIIYEKPHTVNSGIQSSNESPELPPTQPIDEGKLSITAKPDPIPGETTSTSSTTQSKKSATAGSARESSKNVDVPSKKSTQSTGESKSDEMPQNPRTSQVPLPESSNPRSSKTDNMNNLLPVEMEPEEPPMEVPQTSDLTAIRNLPGKQSQEVEAQGNDTKSVQSLNAEEFAHVLQNLPPGTSLGEILKMLVLGKSDATTQCNQSNTANEPEATKKLSTTTTPVQTSSPDLAPPLPPRENCPCPCPAARCMPSKIEFELVDVCVSTSTSTVPEISTPMDSRYPNPSKKNTLEAKDLLLNAQKLLLEAAQNLVKSQCCATQAGPPSSKPARATKSAVGTSKSCGSTSNNVPMGPPEAPFSKQKFKLSNSKIPRRICHTFKATAIPNFYAQRRASERLSSGRPSQIPRRISTSNTSASLCDCIANIETLLDSYRNKCGGLQQPKRQAQSQETITLLANGGPMFCQSRYFPDGQNYPTNDYYPRSSGGQMKYSQPDKIPPNDYYPRSSGGQMKYSQPDQIPPTIRPAPGNRLASLTNTGFPQGFTNGTIRPNQPNGNFPDPYRKSFMEAQMQNRGYNPQQQDQLLSQMYGNVTEGKLPLDKQILLNQMLRPGIPPQPNKNSYIPDLPGVVPSIPPHNNIAGKNGSITQDRQFFINPAQQDQIDQDRQMRQDFIQKFAGDLTKDQVDNLLNNKPPMPPRKTKDSTSSGEHRKNSKDSTSSKGSRASKSSKPQRRSMRGKRGEDSVVFDATALKDQKTFSGEAEPTPEVKSIKNEWGGKDFAFQGTVPDSKDNLPTTVLKSLKDLPESAQQKLVADISRKTREEDYGYGCTAMEVPSTREAPLDSQNSRNEKFTEENPTDVKNTEGKYGGNITTDRKYSSEKPTERKHSSEKPTERKHSDEKPSERKPSYEKPSERKPSDEKHSERKPSERKSSDEKPSERNNSDEKPTERKLRREKSPEGNHREEKSPEENLRRKKSSEGKYTDEKSTQDKSPEKKYIHEKSGRSKARFKDNDNESVSSRKSGDGNVDNETSSNASSTNSNKNKRNQTSDKYFGGTLQPSFANFTCPQMAFQRFPCYQNNLSPDPCCMNPNFMYPMDMTQQAFPSYYPNQFENPDCYINNNNNQFSQHQYPWDDYINSQSFDINQNYTPLRPCADVPNGFELSKPNSFEEYQPNNCGAEESQPDNCGAESRSPRTPTPNLSTNCSDCSTSHHSWASPQAYNCCEYTIRNENDMPLKCRKCRKRGSRRKKKPKPCPPCPCQCPQCQHLGTPQCPPCCCGPHIYEIRI